MIMIIDAGAGIPRSSVLPLFEREFARALGCIVRMFTKLEALFCSTLLGVFKHSLRANLSSRAQLTTPVS